MRKTVATKNLSEAEEIVNCCLYGVGRRDSGEGGNLVDIEMPSLRSLVVRRAPQIEMGAATSSVTSITPLKNVPDQKKVEKVEKLSGIRLSLLRKESSSVSLTPADKPIPSEGANAPLLRPESCASLEARGSWVSLGPGVLRKCETAMGLSTLALEGRPVNRSRVCSRCSSLLSLASSSRYSLAAGNFVPASSQSISGRLNCKICFIDVPSNNTMQIKSCGCSYCKDVSMFFVSRKG